MTKLYKTNTFVPETDIDRIVNIISRTTLNTEEQIIFDKIIATNFDNFIRKCIQKIDANPTEKGMRCKFYNNIKNIVGEYKLRDRREFDQCRNKGQGQRNTNRYSRGSYRGNFR